MAKNNVVTVQMTEELYSTFVKWHTDNGSGKTITMLVKNYFSDEVLSTNHFEIPADVKTWGDYVVSWDEPDGIGFYLSLYGEDEDTAISYKDEFGHTVGVHLSGISEQILKDDEIKNGATYYGWVG